MPPLGSVPPEAAGVAVFFAHAAATRATAIIESTNSFGLRPPMLQPPPDLASEQSEHAAGCRGEHRASGFWRKTSPSVRAPECEPMRLLVISGGVQAEQW